jgi:hypothetical protein
MPPPPFEPPSAPSPIITPANGGRNKWWIIAGGLGLVVAAIVGFAALSSGGDDDTSSSPTEPSVTPDTTEASPTTEAPATTEEPLTTDPPDTTEASPTTEAASAAPTTESPASSAPPSGQPRCGYLGVDDFDDMQVELEFTNPLGAVPAVEVAFALLDGSGTRFHTGSESFDLPQADERFRAEVDTVSELPADVDGAAVSCQVLDISEGFGYDDVQLPPESSSCEVTEIDEFNDIQIVLSTTSPYDSTETLDVYYALRDGDGARFSDSYSSVEFVAPGEAIRVPEDTVTEVPTWTTSGEISCDILGVRASDF